MPRCFWVTLTDTNHKDMPHEFWKKVINKDGKETKFKKPRVVIPMSPGTEFEIKVRVEPDAWHYHKEDWYCARLNIDGEFARERFFPRQQEGQEWIFDTWKSGHRYKTAHRTTGSAKFQESDCSVGKIEVEFYPARSKYQDELATAERRFFDSQSDRGDEPESRNVDMSANHFQAKFHNSTLRTTKGSKIGGGGGGGGGQKRSRFGAPAKVMQDIEPIGRMVLYYDTSNNLRDRRILQPKLNRDHRQYFPEEDFLDQMRQGRKLDRRAEKRKGKKRLIADLTDEAGGSPTFTMEDAPAGVKREARSGRPAKRQRTEEAAKAEKDEDGNVVILD